MKHYDVAIVGAGPGGYVAAIKAGFEGLKTILIEENKVLGGTCLRQGCIPTKFLLFIAEKYESIKKMKYLGISCENITINWKSILISKNNIIKNNSLGIEKSLISKNVLLYNGHGYIESLNEFSHIIKIKNEYESVFICANRILLAVGSNAPNKFLGITVSGKRLMNSDNILTINKIPTSLIIIGGGVIGCEFASVFMRFHTHITIVEYSDRILNIADKDCSLNLNQEYRKNNICIKTNHQVNNIIEYNKHIDIFISDNIKKQNHIIKGEYCLIATGRNANIHQLFSKNIDLATYAILLKNNLFNVNKYMETNIKGVYAIGDCIDTPWLAHTASAEALIAIEHMIGYDKNKINIIDYNRVPMCVYSIPSISWCGFTEQQMNFCKKYIQIIKYPLVQNSKSSIMLEKNGFIKIIIDKETNEIIGFHIVGKSSVEMIAEPSFIMQVNLTINKILSSIHAHPTLYESIYEAARTAMDKSLYR